MIKKILITGGTGYIGSHLAQKLDLEGYEVTIITRNKNNTKLKTIINDGTFETLHSGIKKTHPDIIIHLASHYCRDHALTDLRPLVEGNINYGLQILESMKQLGIKNFLNTGTAWIYNNFGECDPFNLYAATKLSFNTLLQHYTKECMLNSITLHFNDTYGGEDKRKKLINLLKNTLKNNNSLDMTNGHQFLDIVHINDITNGYLLAIKQIESIEKGSLKNYGLHSDTTINIRDLVNIIDNITGIKLKINWGSKVDISKNMEFPPRISPLPGWTPQINIHDGLKDYLS